MENQDHLLSGEAELPGIPPPQVSSEQRPRSPAMPKSIWITTLPTGTVTFLFTDIERSTSLWERDAGAMNQALLRTLPRAEALELGSGHNSPAAAPDRFVAEWHEFQKRAKAAGAPLR